MMLALKSWGVILPTEEVQLRATLNQLPQQGLRAGIWSWCRELAQPPNAEAEAADESVLDHSINSGMPPPLRVGMRVSIAGLKTFLELNGKLGTIVALGPFFHIGRF